MVQGNLINGSKTKPVTTISPFFPEPLRSVRRILPQICVHRRSMKTLSGKIRSCSNRLSSLLKRSPRRGPRRLHLCLVIFSRIPVWTKDILSSQTSGSVRVFESSVRVHGVRITFTESFLANCRAEVVMKLTVVKMVELRRNSRRKPHSKSVIPAALLSRFVFASNGEQFAVCSTYTNCFGDPCSLGLPLDPTTSLIVSVISLICSITTLSFIWSLLLLRLLWSFSRYILFDFFPFSRLFLCYIFFELLLCYVTEFVELFFHYICFDLFSSYTFSNLFHVISSLISSHSFASSCAILSLSYFFAM